MIEAFSTSAFHTSQIRTHTQTSSQLQAKYEGPGEDIADAFDPESEVSRRGKGQGLDTSVRSKLLAESIAPWRTLRLFTLASAGSGAFIGTLITAGALAASGATGADVNEIYKNITIDLGAVAICAVLFKLDLDKGLELEGNVEKKIERKKEMKKISAAMKNREKDIQKLNVSIRVSRPICPKKYLSYNFKMWPKAPKKLLWILSEWSESAERCLK